MLVSSPYACVLGFLADALNQVGRELRRTPLIPLDLHMQPRKVWAIVSDQALLRCRWYGPR